MLTLFDYVQIVLCVLLVPLFLAVFFLFLILWLLFTITGVGPILQYYYNIRDQTILDRNVMIQTDSDLKLINIPPGIHSCAPHGYTMFVIYNQRKFSSSSDISTSSPAPSLHLPCICIPNGLGATAIFISQIQEKLVDLGFTVLSFDRLGVGLSDRNMSGQSPTAMDMVNEMYYVMTYFQRIQSQNGYQGSSPSDWIIIGPSMGSIVTQCFLSQLHALNNSQPFTATETTHTASESTITTTPSNHRVDIKVTGFLNMDGLPYPFIHFNTLFRQAGGIYHIYAAIIWTGILRPFIGIAFNNKDFIKAFGCKKFRFDQMKAQLNQSQFFGNIGYEMNSMMACCDMAQRAWGCHSVLNIRAKDEALYQILVRAAPSHSYLIDSVTGSCTETSERSVSELGSDWGSDDQLQLTVKQLLDPTFEATSTMTTYNNNNNSDDVSSTVITVAAEETEKRVPNYGTVTPIPHSTATTFTTTAANATTTEPLVNVFQQLVVRVMSARCHDFGNPIMNSFYTQEMRDMAAAEHSQHWLFARQPGSGSQRHVYPRLSHMAMFAQSQHIADNTLAIARSLQSSSSSSSTGINI